MKNFIQNEINYSVAQERVKQLKKFYTSITIFALVFVAYYMYKYYRTGDVVFLDFNNFSIIFWIWGLIIALRGIKLFFLNQDWERKMIDKELNKN